MALHVAELVKHALKPRVDSQVSLRIILRARQVLESGNTNLRVELSESSTSCGGKSPGCKVGRAWRVGGEGMGVG